MADGTDALSQVFTTHFPSSQPPSDILAFLPDLNSRGPYMANSLVAPQSGPSMRRLNNQDKSLALYSSKLSSVSASDAKLDVECVHREKAIRALSIIHLDRLYGSLSNLTLLESESDADAAPAQEERAASDLLRRRARGSQSPPHGRSPTDARHDALGPFSPSAEAAQTPNLAASFLSRSASRRVPGASAPVSRPSSLSLDRGLEGDRLGAAHRRRQREESAPAPQTSLRSLLKEVQVVNFLVPTVLLCFAAVVLQFRELSSWTA